MFKPFNARNWYWKADNGRVFSSARGQVVPVSDAALASWSADGSGPTTWPRDDDGAQTDAALRDVLAPYGLTGPGSVPVVPQSASRAQGGA